MRKLKQKDNLVDSKGRLLLGSHFSGRQYIQTEQADGIIILTPAVTVPAKEAWLWNNPEAMESVQRGLRQTKNKEFAKDPRKEKDYSWMDELED